MSGKNVLQKLPPHVARELRRHISPKPLVSPFAKVKAQNHAASQHRLQPQQSSGQHRMVFIGCTALTVLAGCTPLLLYYWVKPLNESDVPLTAPQIRRGAFQNSGSKDVGKDYDWDFHTGTHKLRAGYGNINTDNEDSTSTITTNGKDNTLPAEFLAMAPNELKKVEDKIEAFAKGRGRNN
jgi:hypothetical protein